MRPFEFIIAIVGIALCYSAFMTLIKARHGRAEASKETEMAADLEADRERLVNLEERVAVLERIVTDRTSSLHRQFSDLE